MRTCPYCEEVIDPDDASELVNGRWYHDYCAESLLEDEGPSDEQKDAAEDERLDDPRHEPKV